MGKSIPDEGGEKVIKGGKADPAEPRPPGKPPRRFPYRLWLFAILMTAGAAAGGYFAYQYRDQAQSARRARDACEVDKVQVVADRVGEAQAACATDKAALGDQLTAATTDRDVARRERDECGVALGSLKAEQQGANDRIAKLEEFERSFADMVKTGDLKVAARHGSLVFELPSEVMFPSASADLSKAGYVTLIQFAGILKEPKFADRRFLVVGHTDNLPLKSTVYKDNWSLSVARGLTVTRTLVEGGVKPENLVASGAGDNDPIADNTTPAGRAKNRRIEITLLPALADLPPLPKDVGGDAASP